MPQKKSFTMVLRSIFQLCDANHEGRVDRHALSRKRCGAHRRKQVVESPVEIETQEVLDERGQPRSEATSERSDE